MVYKVTFKKMRAWYTVGKSATAVRRKFAKMYPGSVVSVRRHPGMTRNDAITATMSGFNPKGY